MQISAFSNKPATVQLPDDNYPLNADGTSLFEKPITDQLINDELNLPVGESLRNAKVIGRSKDHNGNMVGSYSENLIYDVEFQDGEIREYAANVIAENKYSQVDAKDTATSC